MHGIWGASDTAVALEQLTQDFVDQTAFMEYFKSHWVPKIGKMSLSLSLVHILVICQHHVESS